MSLVSIIIPYYKKKDDINTTINSILNQNFNNYEIIIVYDDENKEDLKLIQEIKKKDERIKLLINERNLGAGESRNRGIKIAKGQFIAFIDADDIWKPLKLSKQIDFMIKNGEVTESFFEGTFLKDDIAFCNEIRSAIEITMSESPKN